jgi:glucose/arabinose dehydrogenase
MLARPSRLRQRLLTASAMVSLLASAFGASAPPVVAANPVTTGSPGLFSTGTGPAKPRVVNPAATSKLPVGFVDVTALTGLTQPTKLRVAADGRVFVAEKSGLILEFQSLSDPNPPTVWADLSSEVDDYWDRGLMGLALSPNFVADHTLYVQYAWDHNPVAALAGDPYPNAPAAWNDQCPSPPGPTTDGCTIEGVISRVTGVPSGNRPLGPAQEHVLLTGWCQQFPSHSNDDLWVGSDGDLYATAGDGASFTNFDYGQFGGTTTPLVTPANPCADPTPGDIGTAQSLPTAEGGSMRAQSSLRTDGPTVLNGALIRINPNTGLGVPGNPYYATSTDPDKQRILAFGLRNPFRITFQPGKNVVWIGDVGDATWEEIDQLPLPAADGTNNFGWPCDEGPGAHPGWPTNLNQCTSLLNAVAPYYTYNHSASVSSGDGCLTGSSSISGMTFYTGSAYPANYQGALFFTDHSRDCIWAMLPQANGDPNPTKIVPIDVGSVAPPSCLVCGVDLETDPATGDVLYVDYDAGQIHQIEYGAPVAQATADVTNGPAPLTVHLDGSGSTTAAPPLTDAWTIPGGSCDSLNSATPTCTFSAVGSSRVTLTVTDVNGVSATSAPLTITAGDTPPVASIDTIDGAVPGAQPTLDVNGNPPANRPGGVPAFYAVGDNITFSGHATSSTMGTLPSRDLTWNIRIYHCPSNCHTHDIETLTGQASGNIGAPDHPYPSLLWIELTATDSAGLSASSSIYLYPKTSTLSIQTSPSGLTVTAGTTAAPAPFQATFIEGGQVSLSAPEVQSAGGNTYVFSAWSDGGSASHTVTASSPAATYTATYLVDVSSTYHALGPARILDTRYATGLSGVFHSQLARTFQVTGQGGVPSGATAVTGNLTVTGQTAAGYLFLGPVAANHPTSSTLNFPLGDNRANGVTVALGAGGTLSATYIASSLSRTTQVLFDVTGYFGGP